MRIAALLKNNKALSDSLTMKMSLRCYRLRTKFNLLEQKLLLYVYAAKI